MKLNVYFVLFVLSDTVSADEGEGLSVFPFDIWDMLCILIRSVLEGSLHINFDDRALTKVGLLPNIDGSYDNEKTMGDGLYTCNKLVSSDQLPIIYSVYLYSTVSGNISR